MISLDGYDIDKIVEDSDDRSHPNKLYYLASLIYEYVTNKKKNINNMNNKYENMVINSNSKIQILTISVNLILTTIMNRIQLTKCM